MITREEAVVVGKDARKEAFLWLTLHTSGVPMKHTAHQLSKEFGQQDPQNNFRTQSKVWDINGL